MVGLMNTHRSILKEGIRTMMYGDYLPAFSRAMLRDNHAHVVSYGTRLTKASGCSNVLTRWS